MGEYYLLILMSDYYLVEFEFEKDKDPNSDYNQVIRDRNFLIKAAKIFIQEIIMEAKKDLAKQGNAPTPEGRPEGIPADPSFFKSFKYKLEGTTILIYSTWPVIEQIVEGRKSYPMTWLTKADGITHVPIPGDRPNTVSILTAPKRRKDAWIHPGFRKHNFVRRGYNKAKSKVEDLLEDYLDDA